jgi:isoleucyl-tRNA synthetase
VALNTTLTPELIDEGFVREIISKIQTMRKDADFNVTDHIAVTVEGSERICGIIVALAQDIAKDVLADSVCVATPQGSVKEWDVNGEKAVIGVCVV